MNTAITHGLLLQHTANVLARQSDRLLQDHFSIGFSQFRILMALKWRTNVLQKQIAESLGQTEASISRQIKLLSKDGLLSSRIVPDNRRQHLTVLTAKGERMVDEATQLLDTFYYSAFSGAAHSFGQSLAIIHDEECNRAGGVCHFGQKH